MHKKVLVIFIGSLALIIIFAFHFSKIITFFGIILLGGANVLRLVFSNPAGLTDIILRTWSLFLYGLGIKKWHHPWGTVYDSETKEPIHGVLLSLLDVDNKIIARCITDRDGRYGFLVESGFYHINVKKEGYVFPSSELFGKGNDEVYNNLYFGNFIEIKSSTDVITKNIPMLKKDLNWSEFFEKEKSNFHFYHIGDKALGQIINVSFFVGLITSVFILVSEPIKIYNLVILSLYLFAFWLNRNQFGKRAKGSVFFKQNNLPVAYGILRVKDLTNNEIVHQVVSRIGNYYCVIPNGFYNISIDKKNKDGSYTKIYEENNLEVKKAYLDKDFVI